VYKWRRSDDENKGRVNKRCLMNIEITSHLSFNMKIYRVDLITDMFSLYQL